MKMNASETLILVDALFEVFDYKPLPTPIKECEINGNRVPFDYTAKISLQEAIDFYDNATYIGSGHKTWYNGVLNEWDELHHFFIKKIVLPTV